ncbi:MAG TPA: diguanylate cyclase [Polyangiaceae bacterium]|jgi:diguanylate cyclase (GGDEF)-like protein/PAS domain S-box-containing protein|nr:diguanylate cyclase [Polyangiaceae bacterium]
MDRMSQEEWSSKVADPRRLDALLATALLDSDPEEAFDRLTRLCADLIGAPVALVSLVDDRRQFFKSARGLGEPWASRRGTPLTHSFCKHVVSSGQPLIVEDARKSPLLRDNLAITELGVIAYAGVPIESEGRAIGAFCAIEQKPRAWSDEDIRLLRELAHAVEAQIELKIAHARLIERERTLEAVLDTMPAGVLLRDIEGAVVRTNPALETLLGRSASDLLATDFWAITHPDDLPGDAQSREELVSGERSKSVRVKRYRHADGHYVWVRLSAALLRDKGGLGQGTIAVIEDVTAERQAEEAVVRQARIYAAIARSIPRGAVLLFDRDMRYLAADGPELFTSLGLDKASLEGRLARDVASPQNVEPIERLYTKVLAGGSGEFEARRGGRILTTRVAPVWDGAQVVGGIALLLDVTEEREQEQTVRRSKALLEATLANIHDGVVVLDARSSIVLANRAYADLLGLPLDGLVGMTRTQFLEHAATLAEDPAVFNRAIERPEPGPIGATSVFKFVHPRRRTIRRTIAPLELPDGPGNLVVWQDMTAEADLLAERERLALTDALTGIGNRRAAEQALVKAIAGAERAHTPLSVALFDIDHFKRVNDLYGHATGDEVLRRVAATLDAAKRLTDTVARWGGEEFVAVLPVQLDGAVVFCERVRKEIARLVCPGIGHVTISAGVASLVGKEGQESLLGRADQRLYFAKASGRNRVQA